MKSNIKKASNDNIQIPPGKLVAPSIAADSIAEVNFLNPYRNFITKRPLPPLVQNYYDKNMGILHMYAIVFVDSNEDPGSFDVYQQEIVSESGKSQLNFYITYDKPETRVSQFTGYRVNFAVRMPNPGNPPTQIETFLWDEDPRTSRGTVTTVQPA